MIFFEKKFSKYLGIINSSLSLYYVFIGSKVVVPKGAAILFLGHCQFYLVFSEACVEAIKQTRKWRSIDDQGPGVMHQLTTKPGFETIDSMGPKRSRAFTSFKIDLRKQILAFHPDNPTIIRIIAESAFRGSRVRNQNCLPEDGIPG